MLVTYKGKRLEIHDALCMPNVKNLLSVDQLVRMGYIIVFDKGAVGLYASYEDITMKTPFMNLSRKIGEKLWAIEQPLIPLVQNSNLHPSIRQQSKKGKKLLALLTQTLSSVDIMILHLRFAHTSLPTLKIMFPKLLENTEKLPHCDACLSMLYKTRYKKVSDYSKEWEGPGIRIDDTIIKSFYLANNNFSDAKSLITAREETYFTVPYEVSRFPEVSENPESSKICQNLQISSNLEICQNPQISPNLGLDSNHILMVTPDDVPKGYGRMFMTDTKSTSQVSVRGFLYAYIVLDRDTRICEVFLGREKNDLELHLKNFLRKFYNKYKRYPNFWKFDQGGENYSHAVINFLKSCGTQAMYTTTNAHNQNSHVERKICILWDAMLKSLAYTNLPFVYWCYCIVYMGIVQNHMPHRALKFKSPLEMDLRTSYLHMLKVFACGVWYSLPDPNEHETRKLFGLNLGFSVLKMGYVILDMQSRNIVDSRDVHFIESFLPFKSWNSPSKIILNCDHWPKSKPEEKISMQMENMLVKQNNVLPDDVQSGGDIALSPTIIKNSDLSDPEVPISEGIQVPEKLLTPEIYVPSPVHEDPNLHSQISPIPFVLQSPEIPSPISQVGDGLSPTMVMENNGLSPTLIMPKNKKPLTSISDNLSNDSQSFVYGSPGNLFNNDDPLNVSNTPSKEKLIDARRFERFKVNGKKAEHQISKIPAKSEDLTKSEDSEDFKSKSQISKIRNLKSRYLNLRDKIPTVKDFSVQPFAQGPYFEVDDIIDIKDSTLQSDVGYDLKVRWKLMPGETTNQETWEPMENLRDSKDLMKKFKDSKPYQDYMEYKKLSNLYSKPKVSKKTRSYKGVDIQARKRAKNLKDLQAAQDFKDYTAGKSSSPEFVPPSLKSLEDPSLRRSNRLRKMGARSCYSRFP